MGNSQHKYFGSSDAIEIIGNDRWSFIRQRLLRSGQDNIDFGLFCTIVRSRFELAPESLLALIFRAFTSDIHQRIDIDSFISSFAVILSDDRVILLRFVFRVYENDRGTIDRKRVEHILQEAYGDRLKGRYDVVVKTLEQLYSKKSELVQKEFEQWNGRLDIFLDWIVQVLHVFLEPLPVNLKSLHRQYSTMNQVEDILNRYNISAETYHALHRQYTSRFQDAQKLELAQNVWNSWVSPFFVNDILASVVFESYTDSMKSMWKFSDFADFCLLYGSASLELRAQAICSAFIKFAVKLQGDFPQDAPKDDRCDAGDLQSGNADFDSWFAKVLTAMIVVLAQAEDAGGRLRMCPVVEEDESSDDEVDILHDKVGSVELSFGQNAPFLKRELMEKSKRRRSFSLSEASEPTHHSAQKKDLTHHHEHLMATMEKLLSQLPQRSELDEELQLALNDVHKSSCQNAEAYTSLIIKCAGKLPGLFDLSLVSCCLFGVRPSSPDEEKRYITELSRRYAQRHSVSASCPHGPIGTEWHVIAKPWFDCWRNYVGYDSPPVAAEDQQVKAPKKPSYIDNDIVLKTSTSKALLQGLLPGHNFEPLPPHSFAALQYWYGGGPTIVRKVSPITKLGEDGVAISSAADIEYYPLSVFLVTCDPQGRLNSKPKEMLFSKHAVIEDAIVEIARDRRLNYSKIRLWNYSKPVWKEQGIISPELTFSQANIQDGQTILVEISLQDGSWPRAQLQSSLESDASPEEKSKSSPASTAQGTELQLNIDVKRNNGLVGMDNLGNTCYLNSSLQVLLHNKLLVDYFLQQLHKGDINGGNKHGYQGRIANVFGKVVAELWTSKKKSISPRYVLSEIASIRDQFAGNEQHDAHELLAFLLDGLSEDLNLVHSKPYIENPDSDGRPDHELADIWWQNHLKRDRSFVQALFCGQFKSIMHCDCGYSSARFEPFTFLSLPIPEDTHRVLMLLVIPRQAEKTTRCAVRVPKSGTVADILAEIRTMGLDGLPPADCSDDSLHFLIGEMHHLRIKRFIQSEKRIDSVKDSDLLVFFQVEVPFVKGVRANSGSPQSKASSSPPKPQISKQASEDKIRGRSTSFSIKSILHDPAAVMVRVAFTQRKVQYMEGSFAGTRGYDFFRLDTFSIPLLEVLPANIKCGDLYRVVEHRLKAYYKVSVAELIKKKQKLDSLPSDSSLGGFSVSTEDYKKISVPIKSAAADLLTRIQHVSSDEVIGGPIPSKGFTLRLVAGGESFGTACSFCPWLVRCQGCVVPDCDDVEYQLRDGESIAVDWHYEVFEELLDQETASQITTHPSVSKEKNYMYDKKIPLNSCLEKFSEQEALEGVVCPKCHDDHKLKRNFMLWRLPPVLMVQLKRFQFDRIARKKLNQRIDFPIDDLDLSAFVSGATADSADSPNISTHYDLCSVIHHVGALGGGHYVATIREESDSAEGGKWHCFNDNLVSEVTDISGVTAPSAYVLFYVRKDMKKGDLDLLLKSEICKKDPTLEQTVAVAENVNTASSALSVAQSATPTTANGQNTTIAPAEGTIPERQKRTPASAKRELPAHTKKKEESESCISH